MYRIQSVAFLRPALFVFLALLLSLLFSAISHQTASALFENNKTSTLILGGDSLYNGTACTQEDLTTSWYQIVSDNSADTYSYKNTWNASYGAPYNGDLTSFADDFRAHIESGATSGWGVSQQSYAEWVYNTDSKFNDGMKEIQLYLFDPAATFTVYEGYIASSHPIRSIVVGFNPNAGCRYQASQYSSTSQGYNINFQYDKFLFLSTDNITYDPSYTGEPIPSAVGEEEELPVVRPDYTYSLDNKKVKAHDYNLNLPTFTPDEGYTFSGYSVEWTLFKCSDFDVITITCADADDVDYQILSQDSDYEYTVDDYSDYMLTATYLVQQCYRYPSYPATPDHCFYVDLETEMPDYEFVSTSVYLEINGQSITGDTSNEQCDASGFCAPSTLLCDLEPDFITQMNCRFTRTFNTGLINPSINAFKNLFTSLVVPASPTCEIPIQNVAISPGRSFPLSDYSAKACASATQFRNAFPIGPVLINFFIAMVVLMMIVKIVNRLLDNKQNDIIEGVA